MHLTGNPTRDKILAALKLEGPLLIEALAQQLGITPMGVRQHLNLLVADGFVAKAAVRGGVGRPAYAYRLSPAGNELFPRDYSDFAVMLLDLVSEGGDLALAETLLAERCRRFRDTHRPRLHGLPPAERAGALAELRTGHGYMTHLEQHGEEVHIVQHNCALHDVACRYHRLCKYEAEAFGDLLQADVRLEETIAKGDHVCRFIVTRRRD